VTFAPLAYVPSPLAPLAALSAGACKGHFVRAMRVEVLNGESAGTSSRLGWFEGDGGVANAPRFSLRGALLD
jgi:hypothetical protein